MCHYSLDDLLLRLEYNIKNDLSYLYDFENLSEVKAVYDNGKLRYIYIVGDSDFMFILYDYYKNKDVNLLKSLNITYKIDSCGEEVWCKEFLDLCFNGLISLSISDNLKSYFLSTIYPYGFNSHSYVLNNYLNCNFSLISNILLDLGLKFRSFTLTFYPDSTESFIEFFKDLSKYLSRIAGRCGILLINIKFNKWLKPFYGLSVVDEKTLNLCLSKIKNLTMNYPNCVYFNIYVSPFTDIVSRLKDNQINIYYVLNHLPSNYYNIIKN